MEIKSYNDILSDIRSYIIAHQDRLTDFNDGSVLESYSEAVSRELAQLYIRTRVGFSTYLRALPYSVFNFQMKNGLKASARVVFSRSKPYSYDTTIPTGTIVSAGSYNFFTTEAGTVPAGETSSAPVAVSAQSIGEKYNAGAGMIKTIVSTISADVVSVNNQDAATGGADAEDWGAYMDRFAEYILGLQRTNGYGFLSGLTQGHLVRSMQIDEHFPPLDNIWNMSVYLEDGSGGMTDDALSEVKNIIDGKMTPSNGGYRAPGINIRYLTPEIVPITLDIEVKVERDVVNDIDESVVVFEVIEAITKFVNSLKIGEEVKRSDIIIVLKRISYVGDAKITFPLENVPINTHQTARYEDCAVTVVIE